MEATFLFSLIFAFGIGLCVGSFINVVVYRLNHGKNPLKGRSFCPKCKKKIAWYDNIPLLSFVLLKGKCRHCREPISWQYPLVELGMGVLFVLVTRNTPPVTHFFWPETCYLLLVTCYLVAVFVSDLIYETIPDQITYPGILTSGILGFLGISGVEWQNGVLAGLSAAGFFLVLHLLTRGRGMGMGDVKLGGLMGLVLGFPKVVVALMLAFLTGAVVGVILILLGKRRFGQHLAFGPFLTSATWVSLFWGEKIVDFYFSLLGI